MEGCKECGKSLDPSKHVVLVTGGSYYSNVAAVERAMGGLHPRPALVVCGANTGVETIVQRWCIQTGTSVAVFPAQFSYHRETAEKVRNRAIFSHIRPHLVVAFPGDESTAHVVSLAKELDIPVTFTGRTLP